MSSSPINKVNNNCRKDAIRVVAINFVTTLVFSMFIFALVSNQALKALDRCKENRRDELNDLIADASLRLVNQNDNNKQLQLPPQSKQQSRQLIDNIYDYYDLSDAIASIKSLDKQLNSYEDLQRLNNQRQDYLEESFDSDKEFILDLSKLITAQNIDDLANQVPYLKCLNLTEQLNLIPRDSSLLFVYILEAIVDIDNNKSNSNTWTFIYLGMLLLFAYYSLFGLLKAIMSSMIEFVSWYSVDDLYDTNKLTWKRMAGEFIINM